MCGIQTHKGSPFQAHIPGFPQLQSPRVTPPLVNFINQYKYKIVCYSVLQDQELVLRISVTYSEYNMYQDHGIM